MDAPRLIEPSVDFESSYRSYVEQLRTAGERLVPFPLALSDDSFEKLVATLEASSRGEGIPEGFVPSSTFWLVVGPDIVAVSNLRHRLTPALERRGGHIGYSVRPKSRRKGYGSLVLRLTLHEASKLGVATALITCAKDNTASVRVIRTNGGVLVSEELVPEDGEVVQRYHVPIVQPNSALLSDAYPPALRASSGAPKRGR